MRRLGRVSPALALSKWWLLHEPSSPQVQLRLHPRLDGALCLLQRPVHKYLPKRDESTPYRRINTLMTEWRQLLPIIRQRAGVHTYILVRCGLRCRNGDSVFTFIYSKTVLRPGLCPVLQGKDCQMPANPCIGAEEDPCGGSDAVGACKRNPNSPLGFSCGCSETPGWEASSGSDQYSGVGMARSRHGYYGRRFYTHVWYTETSESVGFRVVDQVR